MGPEVKAYLYDIQQACELLQQFVAGKSFTDYQTDAMLRSAVERQFEIFGETMGKMLKLAPELADHISDTDQIIAFRNILIHGYARISNDAVWGVLETNLPQLRQEVKALLAPTP